MPFCLHLAERDLLNCRFAISPLWETQEAVRTLARPERHAYHLPWLRRTRQAAASLDLRPLWALMPPGGHSPDFVCPMPSGPGSCFEEELARVRSTPADVARADMAAALACTPEGTGGRTGQALLADPARTVQHLADLLQAAWHALVEPEWPRLRTLLEADVAHHSRRLAEVGFARLVGELSPRLAFEDATLRIRGMRGDHTRVLGGQGLVLVPSAFCWPDVISGYEPPWQPAVVYPVRGIGGLWTRSSAAAPEPLAALLGRARAGVLCALDEPSTTTDLARVLSLAPSSVSAHLSVLRSAGLLTSRRYGHRVLYARTPLGTALAGAEG
ncbi:DUF5937 family protein [Streptomyces sp. C10-9-1]|uniref:ArsR/SmtB family transcription factor n=1 Tax=Streptomyces sp. C10-9-1 TaxID=1859285 RepID=UPI003D70EAAB